ncbi:phosphoserine phosphatase SerB [Parasphingopyxis algicola]|uniref:phosphoserine phosphatase SerB n=1 Tax=Parasphingopyxis algicola TaxID=2026624 RepID=UPI0015A05099|nr:phosphoserine phosphatase SerB [Parasphingopyxis algicola]QLC23855.1 phosphoserine phosphatase SerB [Parasphingopyxis algicola]
MFIATLIAADRLSAGDISLASDLLAEAGADILGHMWIEPDKAVDIRFSGDLVSAREALSALGFGIDYVAQPEAARAKKLFVADMDSTMITVECLDELADYAGFKPQVAAITERAMRGELDFVEALDERVALLADMDAAIVTRCHEERVVVSPGAATLVRTMKAHDVHTVLVSGGFTLFADRVAVEIGFDRAVANRLDIAAGRLTGRVVRPIVDSATKQRVLQEETERLELGAAETLAIGDGANDLAMVEQAGLGVAYRGKPKLRDVADARIDHGDLTALLYAQGYARKDWVEG